MVGAVTALFLLGLSAPASAATPVITSFTPTIGPVGCEVIIIGSNFQNPAVTDVDFNSAAAAFSVISDGEIDAVVPLGATTGPIHATNASGTATSSTFTVGGMHCAPTIRLFSPISGLVGTSVTITGTNLSGATSVTFNGVSAAITSNTATQVVATVPTLATTGPIRLVTPGGTATSSTNFTVITAPLPTISSFTPISGPVGTSVAITGTSFSGTGFTTTAVRFNLVPATTFTVGSSTQITATVPPSATTGQISVTTPGGIAISTATFTVSKLHARSVSLILLKHLVARGLVSVTDGTRACASKVSVKIQRLSSGAWYTVKSTTTTSTGSYGVDLRDVVGKYRAKAPAVTLPSGGVCGLAESPRVEHRH